MNSNVGSPVLVNCLRIYATDDVSPWWVSCMKRKLELGGCAVCLCCTKLTSTPSLLLYLRERFELQSIMMSYVSVCLFVCPLAYLRNYTAKLQFSCILTIALARWSCGGFVMKLGLCTSGFVDDVSLPFGSSGTWWVFLSGERTA